MEGADAAVLLLSVAIAGPEEGEEARGDPRRVAVRVRGRQDWPPLRQGKTLLFHPLSPLIFCVIKLES